MVKGLRKIVLRDREGEVKRPGALPGPVFEGRVYAVSCEPSSGPLCSSLRADSRCRFAADFCRSQAGFRSWTAVGMPSGAGAP